MHAHTNLAAQAGWAPNRKTVQHYLGSLDFDDSKISQLQTNKIITIAVGKNHWNRGKSHIIQRGMGSHLDGLQASSMVWFSAWMLM